MASLVADSKTGTAEQFFITAADSTTGLVA
jgi:hypothetical protein